MSNPPVSIAILILESFNKLECGKNQISNSYESFCRPLIQLPLNAGQFRLPLRLQRPHLQHGLHQVRLRLEHEGQHWRGSGQLALLDGLGSMEVEGTASRKNFLRCKLTN